MRSSLALMRTSALVGVLLSLGYLARPESCIATPITYKINQTISAGSVTGTIETNGAIGVLGSAGIIGWDLELKGPGASFNLSKSNSVVLVGGADVTATATALFFNFSGAADSFLLFQKPPTYSGYHYYCDAVTTESQCGFSGATVVPQYFYDPSTQHFSLTGKRIIGTAAPKAAVAAVPEPASAALLGAGLLCLLGIVRRWRIS
jgi:hypothetical protein